MRILIIVVASLSIVVSGCLYRTSWETPRTSRHSGSAGPPKVASTQLDGSAELDGATVVYTLRDQATCVVETKEYETTTRELRKTWFPGMLLPAIAGGGGLFGLYIAGMVSISDEHTFGGTDVYVSGGAIAFGVLSHFYFLVAPRSKTKRTTRTVGTSTQPSACDEAAYADAARRRPKQLSLRTPWGDTLSADVDGDQARFDVDWRLASHRPLTEADASRFRQPWVFSDGTHEVQWQPDDATARAMVVAVGSRYGLDLSVRAGEAPPNLIVVGFEAPEPIQAGTPVALALVLENRGKGNAYRVEAVTKSSDPALHGLRFVFGRIAPRATARSVLEVELPRGHRYHGPGGLEEVRIAFHVTEANANSPDPAYHSVKVRPAPRPRLQVACVLPKAEAREGRYPVDAGRQLRLSCTLENVGDGPASAARVEAQLVGGASRDSTSRDLAPGARTNVDVLLQIPGHLRADDQLELLVIPKEDSFREPHLSSHFKLIVRFGKVCDPGLTRAEYDARREGVRKQRAAGILSDEDARYIEDALLSCLSAR